MKCIICDNITFKIICKTCQNTLLQPSFHKREIQKGFFNYSFYALSDIEKLLNSKYYFHGDRVFELLAKLSFLKFAQNFNFRNIVYAIAIDDHVRHDFSHTAILAKSLKSEFIKPKYNCIKAQNYVKYAGKSLEFRKNNPRDFKVSNIQHEMTILCDDIITTGATIKEAKKAIEQKDNEVLFSLTLADAKL
ncbi:MAG: ComF family protein [Campylobacterota bacterium]